jgi:hypothetical protein
MRVGAQARVGIDSIVGGPPEPMALNGTVLGLDSYVGSDPADHNKSRIGKQARIGKNTLVS